MNRGKKGLRSFLQKMQRRFLPVFLSLVMVIGYVPTNVGTVAVWAESGGAEASGDNGQPAQAASVPDVQSAETPTPEPEPQPVETPAPEPEPQPVETPAPEPEQTETPDVVVNTPETQQPTETPAPAETPQPVETPAAQQQAKPAETKPEIKPFSVEDDDKTVYYEIKYIDENGQAIEVNLNPGEKTPDRYTQYVKAGANTQPPHRPVISGEKKFVGWFTEPEGQGQMATDESFQNIQADATWYAYYTAQTVHTITINYVFANDGNEASKPYVVQVPDGDPYSATVQSPELEGYTADKGSVEINIPSVTEDVTYTVKYTGEVQTYTVEHQWESLENPGQYITHESETKQGYIGQQTEAEPKTYEGFTLAEPIQNIQITASTTADQVIIPVKYARQSYQLTFDTGEGGSYVAAMSVKYGTPLSQATNVEEPTRLGYTFQGWRLANGETEIGDTTMPASDYIVRALWEENRTAEYTIVYWLESLNGGYDYITQKSGTGRVGNTIDANNLANWEWDEVNIESAGVERDYSKDQDVTITADGKAVKNVYYSRKTFTISFYIQNGGRWVEDDSLRITAKYGAYIADQWNDSEHAAYEWNTQPNGNTSYTLLANMKAEDIRVYQARKGSGTTITYYIEGLNGEREVYQTLTAADGVSLTVEDQTRIDGFSFDSWKDTTGWFDNDLWLYYTRNDYTISFENCEGISDAILKFEESLSHAQPDTRAIQPPAGVDSDYVFGGWYTSPALEEGTEVNWNSIMPSHNLQLYAKWVAPEYTVSFETNGAGNIDSITVPKYHSIEDQMPADPVKEGDEFQGWYLDKECQEPFLPTMGITSDITLFAKWKSAYTWNYTIQYVDESNQPIDGVESTKGSASANTYITVKPIDIEGYTPKEGTRSVRLDENGKIIRVVYTKDQTWSYRVRYIDATTQRDIISSETVEVGMNTKQVIVNSPSVNENPAFKGYTLVSAAQVKVTQEEALKEGEGNIYTITFQYVKQEQQYKVDHQLQMPDGTYVTVETETPNGNVGQYVTAEPKNYDGFQCVSTELQRSGVVTASGLIITVQYDRTNALTVTDYEGKYDGQAHGLTVTGEPANTDVVKETLLYSINGEEWSETPVTETDVNTGAEGKYTVYTRVQTVVTGGGTYTSQPETHYINILPREVTLTAPDATKMYDGAALNTWYTTPNYKEAEVSGDKFVTGEGFDHYVYTAESSILIGEGKNVIDQSATLAALKDNTKVTNYNFTFVDGTLTVTDRPDEQKYVLNITPDSSTVTYNGTEQSVSGFSTDFLNGEGEDAQQLNGYRVDDRKVSFGASGTDADTYSVEQTGDVVILDSQNNDVTAQFKVNISDATLTINKRPVTIAAKSAAFDYDGQPHSLNESEVTSEIKLVDGHTYTATIEGTVQEQNEIADNVISDITILDGNNNDVTENYEITPVNGRLRVNAIDADITAKVVIADKETVYNGAEQKFTELDGDNYTVTFEGTEGFDTAGWTIAGTEISTSAVNAGKYDVYFADPTQLKVLDKDGNPVESAEVSVTFGHLTITQAPLTLTADSAEKEYDGTPLTANSYKIEGLRGEDKIASITINGSQLAPGTSDNVIREGSVNIQNANSTDTTDNYKITLEKGTLTVKNDGKTERAITVKANSGTKIYDGTALTNNTFQVTGEFLNSDDVDRTQVKVTGSQIYVGTSKNTIDASTVHVMNGSVDVTEAYTIKTLDADLTVTARSITLTADSKSKVYDGTPLTAQEVSMTGSLAETDKFESEPQATGSQTESGSSSNPVGTVRIVDKESGEDRTDNYKITPNPGTLTVTKAPAAQNAVTIGSDSLVYDGQAHALKEASSLVTEGTTIYYATVQNPSKDDWSTEMPSFTNVGAHTIYVKAVNPNYEDAFANGTLTITSRPVTISGNTGSFTYNGKEQTVDGFTAEDPTDGRGLLKGHTVENVTASASAKDVGTRITGTITAASDVKITADGEDVTANYDIITSPGWITITPLEIKVASESGEQLYTGQPLKVQKAEITEGALAEGDEISYNFTGTQAQIGSSENTFTAIIRSGDTTITNNYSIQYTYGTLTVYGEIAYNANGGTGDAPAADRFDRGDTYTVKENMFQKEGYTFTGWNTRANGTGNAYAENSSITELNRNLTLYAQWSANEDTEYKVETYLEGEDGIYPETPETSVTRTAKTDTKAEVTEDDLTAPTGYAFDPEADNILSGNVKGDGSLVLKIYFAKDDKGGGEDGEDPDNIPDRYQIIFRYKAEAHGSVAGTTTEVHTFGNAEEGYTLPTATTPDAAVEAKADPGYHITGWTDEAGEELGAETAPAFDGQTYAEDQTFTVSFAENEDITIKYVAEANGTVSRDQETIAPATGTPEGSVATPAAGYHLEGWYRDGELVSTNLNFVPEPNEDGIYEEATYTAKFAPEEQTLYTVNFYYTDENGNYSEEPTSSEERNGVTDTRVSVTDEDKVPAREGYILDSSAGNVFEGTIAGDGSLVLKVYFALDEKGGGDDGEDPDDIPDRYQIVFKYVAGANGTVTGTTAETHTFGNAEDGYTLPAATTPNAEVTAAANPGYHIAGWTDESGTDLGAEAAPVFGELTYAEDQTFTVTFQENGDITINYVAKEHGSVSRDKDVIAPATGTPEGSVAQPDTGYHFDGWYLGEDKVGGTEDFVPSKNAQGIYEEATYVAKFAPDEATQYTVEFYYETNGEYPEETNERSVRTGTTDTAAAVTEEDKVPARENYILDTSAPNVFEGIIAGDGSLVLKVYFALDVKGGGEDGDEPDNIPDRYQIVFRYVAEAHGTVTGEVTEVHTFGNAEDGYTLPDATTPDAAVTAAANAGYHIAGWTDEADNDLGTDAAPVFGELTYKEDQTFTVSFAENGQITIKYEADEHGKVTRESETLAPVTGTAQGSVAEPDEGYHVVGWYLGEEEVGTDPTFVPSRNDSGVYEEATYTAKFAPDEDTRYTVEFYYENDGTYPDKADETLRRTGTTDTTVSVTDEDRQPKRENYVLDPSAENIFEGTVKGDGSLVLKVYFALDVKGGGDDGDEPDKIPDRYQIVFKYVAEANGTVTGTTAETRTFGNEEDGYTLPEAVEPNADVEAKANAGYHIAGWTDEADNDLGADAAPVFGGLTYAEDQTFTVSFEENDEITIKYEAEANGSVSNESDTIAPATGTPKGSEAEPDAGYHFDGWYLGENKVSENLNFVPAKNADGIYEEATYTAKFLPDEETKYTVNFYYSDEDGNYPSDPSISAVRSGETNTTAAVTDEDKVPAREGYILDTSAPNVFEGTIAGNGSLVLKVYFALDEKGGGDDGDEPDDVPDRYQIVFKYTAEENGTVTGEVTEVHTFGNAEDGYTLPTPTTPDAKVEAAANAGYHIDGWRDEAGTDLGEGTAPEFGTTTYTTDQTFTVSFAENEAVTILYKAEANGSVTSDGETLAPATGTAKGSEAEPDAGYHLDGWYLNDEKVGEDLTFVPSRNDQGIYEAATYVAKFLPDEDTEYRVNFYYSDADGNYSEDPTDTSVRQGTTDTTAEVTAEDKTPARDGYVLDVSADNVFSGNITGDGKLVLKVYFAADEKGGGDDGDEPDDIPDRYQIVFKYVAEANGTVTGTTAETRTFGNEEDGYTLPTPVRPYANVEAAGDPGYHIAGWTDEADNDLGADAAPVFGELLYAEDQTFTVSFAEDEDITIRYEAEDHGTVTNESETIAPATGIPAGSEAVPDEGYHLEGWYCEGQRVGGDLTFVPSRNDEGIYEEATYTARFAPDEDTEYHVEFYYSDTEGNYPDEPSQKLARQGTTDTVAELTEADKTPTRENYILDTSADNVFAGTITGDGKLVLKVYFALDEKGGGDDGDEPDDVPDRYQIVFKYVAEEHGTVTGEVTEIHTFGNAEEGYTLPTPTEPDAAVKAAGDPGYHVAGWTDEAGADLGTEEAPVFGGQTYAEDQIFTVSFEENEDITIRYEAEAHGSVSRDSDTIAPATGTPEGSEATPDTGYHFEGWYRDGEKVSINLNFVPSRNDDGIYEEATYTARFAPDEQTLYMVEYYYTDENGNYPDTATETAKRNGVTDTEASVTEEDKQPTREGYILDMTADNIFSGNIAGDGSLVLKLYFAKDTKGGGDDGDEPDDVPDRYQIVFKYVAEENGTVTGTLSEVHTFGNAEEGYTLPTPTVPDAAVKAAGDPGYHVAGWTDEAGEDLGAGEAPVFDGLTYTEDQTFTVSFEENEDITIRYEAEENGTVTKDSETLAPATGTAEGSEAEPEEGYHLAGWYLGEELVGKDLTFIPSRNEEGIYEEATYTARFEPDEDTPYQVEFYYSDENGNYPGEPSQVLKRLGTTGETVSVTAADRAPVIAGYVLDETAANIFEGTVAGDGSLVLKLYFAKDALGGGDDGNQPDGIPDCYQIIFRYVADGHGSVEGAVTEVHTFRDAEGNYTRPSAVVPNAAVRADADAGYVIDIWSDADGRTFGNEAVPAIDRAYAENMTFTVTFKAEKKASTAGGKTQSGTSAGTKVSGTTRKSPKTGDETMIGLWLALAVLAAGGSTGLTIVRRRKKSEEE